MKHVGLDDTDEKLSEALHEAMQLRDVSEDDAVGEMNSAEDSSTSIAALARIEPNDCGNASWLNFTMTR